MNVCTPNNGGLSQQKDGATNTEELHIWDISNMFATFMNMHVTLNNLSVLENPTHENICDGSGWSGINQDNTKNDDFFVSFKYLTFPP